MWVRALRDETFTAMLVDALKPLELRRQCGPWLHVLDGLLCMVPDTQVCSLPDIDASLATWHSCLHPARRWLVSCLLA